MTVQKLSPEHEAVGAYALGVLDPLDVQDFEQHMARCDACAQRLDEFIGLRPSLAPLAEVAATVSDPAVLQIQPGPQLLERLVTAVDVKRRGKRRRNLYLIAAAALLIIGGPVVTTAVTSDTWTDQAIPLEHSTSPARDAFLNHVNHKVEATDPVSRVTATVGTEEKVWGTHAVLELKNVKGPLRCSLIAVSKSGAEEVVTSWSVPRWGYGIPHSTDERSKDPLYVHGGAAMPRNSIDHFEVRSFEGERLVKVYA
ncbi:zf-HC2 domain-containing protein [Streptomyces sp. NBC_01092]|uniref:zf-HC2 domain-containing protein n=1 Tax=Streptomyces sp. NBC_01092 TaxID=2903748 RepID=UPI003869F77D|nr:zf-HC2 domain-containing protein [Streptomyces sp. NBC_01092]